MQVVVYMVFLLIILSCGNTGKQKPSLELKDSKGIDRKLLDSPVQVQGSDQTVINTGNTTPKQLVEFAASLQGVPYKYGSADPQQGFDCSGFITYVFNHFKISVPRSSVDFTSVSRPVNLKDAKTGDLILFTGTDSTVKVVGHMGILVAKAGEPL